MDYNSDNVADSVNTTEFHDGTIRVLWLWIMVVFRVYPRVERTINYNNRFYLL